MTHSIELYVYGFILEKGIRSLPINFQTLCKLCTDEGYEILFYEEKDAKLIISKLQLEEYLALDAFTVVDDDIKTIFLNNALSYSERCYAIAHELGHIWPQHTKSKILGKSPDKDKTVEDAQEREANDFATCLLAPPCVLKVRNINTLNGVERLTGLPESRAKDALISLLEKDDPPSSLEQAVIETFKEPQKPIKIAQSSIPTVQSTKKLRKTNKDKLLTACLVTGIIAGLGLIIYCVIKLIV